MTKLRDPLTFELALTRIAGEIGWDRAAELVGRDVRTLRYWSDPAEGPAAADMPLRTALLLDCAFRAAGGAGAPLLQCYAIQLELQLGAGCADLNQLLGTIAEAAAEGGEAIAAAIRAARPGASPADIAIAERELEESIAAKTNTLADVRALRGPAEPMPLGAPEVAPPAGDLA